MDILECGVMVVRTMVLGYDLLEGSGSPSQIFELPDADCSLALARQRLLYVLARGTECMSLAHLEQVPNVIPNYFNDFLLL